MGRLAKQEILSNYDKVDLSTCEHCLIGKSIRKPFSKEIRVNFPLQLVHSDICDLMNVRRLLALCIVHLPFLWLHSVRTRIDHSSCVLEK